MKTLVVKTHAFGDSLLATPAVAALIAAGDKVSVLTGPSSLPVWNRLPGIEMLIESPAPCSSAELLLWSLGNRQRGFDRIIHLGSSVAVRKWLGLLTGQKVISGADRGTGFSKIKPIARDYCRIAGVSCSDLKPRFCVTEAEFDMVKPYTCGKPYVVLAPGGGRNARDIVLLKKWPVSRWAEISRHLQTEGYRVFLVGGEQDRDEISSVSGINMAEKLTWGETAAMIYRAALFAGNDSGPAHLAVAGDTPALVLFGPTDFESLYAKGSIIPICGTVPCSPCYANEVFPGCTGGRDCMISINTEKVINALKVMLQR